MSRRDFCKDTVTLYNFIKEEKGNPVYGITVLSKVCCPHSIGVGINKQGKKANNNAKLYIFDTLAETRSKEGRLKPYMPYEEWLLSVNKESYWTITDGGEDFFLIGNSDFSTPYEAVNRFKILEYRKLSLGNRNMWHMEVTAK